jgi:hypothetical protein
MPDSTGNQPPVPAKAGTQLRIDRECLKREEVKLRETVRSFRAADRLKRNDAHARDRPA